MTDMSKEQEAFWRGALSKLRGPFPEIGLPPPVEETTKEAEPEQEKNLINGIDPDAVGNFSKITMDVYFFMDFETHKYFMMQGQTMADYGEMTLRKAVEKVKRRQRRDKG